MAHQSEVDWDALVEDFKAGMNRPDLCAKYKITRQALSKGLRTRGLLRDSETIRRRRTTIKADEATLRELMAPINIERVEAMAEVGAGVLVRHRRQILKAQQAVDSLYDELIFLNENQEHVEERIIEYFGAKAALNPLAAGIYKQQMNQALAAIGLNSKSKTIANLTNALGNLVKIERQAYRLDEEKGDKSYEEHLKELHEARMLKNKAAQLAPPVVENKAA